MKAPIALLALAVAGCQTKPTGTETTALKADIATAHGNVISARQDGKTIIRNLSKSDPKIILIREWLRLPR